MTDRDDAIAAARAIKALNLADWCDDHQITAPQIRALDNQGRHAITQLAGTRVASDTTWQIVAELLETKYASPSFLDGPLSTGADPGDSSSPRVPPAVPTTKGTP